MATESMAMVMEKVAKKRNNLLCFVANEFM